MNATYRRILAYVKPYFGKVALHIIFILVAVFFTAATLTLLEPVLDLLFGASKGVGMPQSEDNYSLNINNYMQQFMLNAIAEKGKTYALGGAILIIVGLNLMGNVFRYFGQFFMVLVRNKVVYDIRKDLFDKINRLAVQHFDKNKKGDTMTRMTSDVTEVERSVVLTFQSFIAEPLTIIFFLLLMVNNSWQLTLFVFALLPVSALLISTIGKSLKKDAFHTQDMLSQMMSMMDEYISGVRIIKAFNAQNYSRKKFHGYNERYRHYLSLQMNKKNLVSPISEFLGVLTIGLILWFGGRLVFAGELNAAGFLTFIFYFQQIMKPAKSLSSAYSNIYRGIASGERIFELMDAPDMEEATKQKQLPLKKVSGLESSIVFKQVSFKYQDDWVLKYLNLKIEKGRSYALVGPSGSGKTTIAELLMGFYSPQQGQILWDGEDLTTLDNHQLRSMMAVVTQEPVLFNDSVFHNIAFGLKNVDKADIVAASKAANAHDFIMELPDAYETNIGDRGNLLSGGQRQRLSIARAILRNPPILILDEATSALDTGSEKKVHEALSKLMKTRTSLIIAHRLSTIQDADEIVVLSNGEIMQQGKHEELILKEEGIYAKLHGLQQLKA